MPGCVIRPARLILEARRAYEALLAPQAQDAAAVALDQLGAAHAVAQAAANAHAAAEEAARALRAAYVAYAAHAFYGGRQRYKHPR